MTRTFVIGHPIKHSRSPLIHNHWIARHGLEGSYKAIDVAPQDLPAFAEDIRKGHYLGGNVTVPHKEQMATLVDVLTPVARQIGAVNTLFMRDGHLHGTNTDADGFAANLDALIPAWRKAGNVLVVGAGGAARAVIHALLSLPDCRISVLNRTLNRAEAMVEDLGTGLNARERIAADSLDRFPELVAGADLVVNTTAFGMDGHDDALPDWLDFARARPSTLVTDIVYVPLQTPFLAAASAVGLKTADGLGMLLHQAAPGFELWYGVKPRVDTDLRRLVLADMGLGDSETAETGTKRI